jgi:periplasmic protein TonB
MEDYSVDMEISNATNMDDIVFANRNRAYGAYLLRKKYNKYILIAFLISFICITITVAIPVIDSYYNRAKLRKGETKEVMAVMEKIAKDVAPPPPPPPPPPSADVVKAVKFSAPVVVADLKETETVVLPEDMGGNEALPPPPDVNTIPEIKHDEVVQEEPVFVVVEENATFQGGDINTFRTWVMEHTRYPESAREMGIEGKVIVQFVINSNGSIEKVSVLRELDPACDAEAIKVIKSSPKWVPGKQGGKPVKQQFVLPIVFKLQNTQ